jgi:group I intron endonuclease
MTIYHIIYQITNNVNGKIYRGKHTTQNLDDEYFGSGKLINRAIQKYGIENFTKEILEYCETVEQLNERERFWVDEEWVLNKDTYNLKLGGGGGWDYINREGLSSKPMSDENRKLVSERQKKRTGNLNSFYGRKHSDETLEKISKASKTHASRIYAKRILDGNHPNNKAACDVCGKIGQYRAMKRWHFANCNMAQSFQN